jgi:hypothetical protein
MLLRKDILIGINRINLGYILKTYFMLNIMSSVYFNVRRI